MLLSLQTTSCDSSLRAAENICDFQQSFKMRSLQFMKKSDNKIDRAADGTQDVKDWINTLLRKFLDLQTLFQSRSSLNLLNGNSIIIYEGNNCTDYNFIIIVISGSVTYTQPTHVGLYIANRLFAYYFAVTHFVRCRLTTYN